VSPAPISLARQDALASSVLMPPPPLHLIVWVTGRTCATAPGVDAVAAPHTPVTRRADTLGHLGHWAELVGHDLGPEGGMLLCGYFFLNSFRLRNFLGNSFTIQKFIENRRKLIKI
jgi:hypothetical protein